MQFWNPQMWRAVEMSVEWCLQNCQGCSNSRPFPWGSPIIFSLVGKFLWVDLKRILSFHMMGIPRDAEMLLHQAQKSIDDSSSLVGVESSNSRH
jgi:hypothetical protein